MAAPRGPVVLRWVLVGCFGATVAITWPLWQHHTEPPVLPLLDVPQVPVAFPLLAALALVLARPTGGWFVLVGVVAYAIVADQTRLQPEVVSLTILLGATLPAAGARLAGQAHVIAVWFWAGLHKVVSAGWDGQALYLADQAGAGDLQQIVAWIAPAVEMAAALLLVPRRTRTVGVVLGVAVPIGILLVLQPVPGDVVNLAVWPWLVGLAASAAVLFSDALDDRPDRPASLAPAWSVTAAMLLLYPAGVFPDLVDDYVGYDVYSGSWAVATVCATGAGCRDGADGVRDALHVPLPPEPRLYRALFDETCRPGDTLVTRDRRFRWSPIPAPIVEERTCPRG